MPLESGVSLIEKGKTMQRISTTLALCLLAGSACAQSVNVDLHASSGVTPSATYGAVPAQIGSWNILTPASNPGITNLVGLNGGASGLTARAVSTGGTGSGSLGTGNFGALMNDYGFGFTQNGGIDVEVNGLDQGFYRAYVYASLSPSEQSYIDGFGFTNFHTNYIGGTIGAASLGFSSTSGPTTSNTFQSGKTHAVLNFVVPAGSPTLTLSVSGDLGNGLAKCAFNGFQLVKITATRLYVNDNATGANTGLSWTDAFTSLQEALTVAKASAGQITEIWVAGGAYFPGTARTSTFNLVEGVDLYGGFAGTETAESLRARPDTMFTPRQALDQWTLQRSNQLQQPLPTSARERYLAVRDMMVRRLQAHGVPLLAGSDGPQFFMVPGFGLHRELEALVQAGLTPYQALLAATRTPAAYLGRGAETGTIAVGKQADLVLLDANPLENISNARRIQGTMLRGQWLARAQLDDLEQRVKAAVRAL